MRRCLVLLLLVFGLGCSDAYADWGQWHKVPWGRKVRTTTFTTTIGETQKLFDGLETDPDAESPEWGQYASFGDALRLPSGTLLGAFYRGGSHSSETSRIVVNRSTTAGRVWSNKLEETLVEETTTHEIAGPSLTRLSSGRVAMVYQRVDIAPGTPPSRQVEYRYSDDSGDTWSAASVFPVVGTEHTSCGCGPVIELGGGTLLTPIYSRESGETRYTARLMQSVDAGANWTQRSVIAQDAESGGARQFEEPYCRRISDGRIMCLVRDDVSDTIYKIYSSDDGVSWGALTSAFSGWGKPPFVQLTNGTIVATTRSTVSPYRGILFYSRDLGASWTGPAEFQDEDEGAYEYAGMFETATANVAGILHFQERATAPTGRTFVWFSELGFNGTPPTHYHLPGSALWASADSYADYGHYAGLDGATRATFSLWVRWNGGVLSGTQTLLSQDASGQRQFTIQTNTSRQWIAAIARTLASTSGTTCTITTPVYQANVWYHVAVVYDGPNATNNDRWRLYLQGARQNCGTYSNTVPAAMTSPNSTAHLVLGSSTQSLSASEFRDGYISTASIWVGTAASDVQVAALYNERRGADPMTAIGTAPTVYIPTQTSMNDGLGVLPAPTVGGTITVPGSPVWIP